MQETTVSRSYAEALLDLAIADGDPDLYAELFRQFVGLLETERDFRSFLETPRVEPDEKKRVIRKVFAGKIPDRLLRFLLVVIDKRRQRLLPSIAAEYSDLADEHSGRVRVEITTAAEPDEALQAELMQRLGQVLDREVLPRYRVNPRIIGGVIVRVGDRILDGSIRHRLQMLRRSLMKAEVG
jgi:F-type H+-transporting ATPase subunit delta